MKTRHRDHRFDSESSQKFPFNRKKESDGRVAGSRSRGSLQVSSPIFIGALVLALFPAIRSVARSAQAAPEWHLPDIPWAFPVRDKVQPVLDERTGPIHVPGSTKTYTQEQIDNIGNPPDWFPDEHAPMPHIVAHGNGGSSLGCASCHLAET